MFSALKDWLNGRQLRPQLACDEEDAALIATSELLTLKPVIYAANLTKRESPTTPTCPITSRWLTWPLKRAPQVIPVCARTEAEIAELDGEDKAMFLSELGLQESGLDRLIKASYTLLGLISFLTAGEDECRAWTITKGTKAPQAAGKIHTDFERASSGRR